MAKKKATSYIALTGLSNDETGAKFTAGDPVSDADFPAGVIKNWLAIGVLTRPETPAEEPESEPAEVVFIEGKKPKGK